MENNADFNMIYRRYMSIKPAIRKKRNIFVADGLIWKHNGSLVKFQSGIVSAPGALSSVKFWIQRQPN